MASLMRYVMSTFLAYVGMQGPYGMIALMLLTKDQPFNPLSLFAGSGLLGFDEDKQKSSSWAFDQFMNPVGTNAPVPVVFGRHMIAPSIASAAVTPRNADGSSITGGGSLPHDFQAVSCMCLCSEGPLPSDWLEQIWINDQELWSEFAAEKIGVGDGSTKLFTLSRKYVVTDQVKVYLDGTEITGKTTAATRTWFRAYTVMPQFGIPEDRTKERYRTFTLTESAYGAKIDVDTMEWRIRAKGGSIHNSSEWTQVAGRLACSFQKIADNKVTVSISPALYEYYGVDLQYKYTAPSRKVTVTTKTDGYVSALIDPAPANAEVVTASGKVSNFPEVKVVSRRGTLDQAIVSEMSGISNTYKLNSYLAYDVPVTYTTTGEVDDVVVTVAALQGLFYYNKDGDIKSQDAAWTIEYRKADDTKWITLYRPDAISSIFIALAATTQAVFYDVSIKETLKAGVKNGITKQAVLTAFTRGRYVVRVTRKDSPNNDANPAKFHDRVWWQTVREFVDDKLSYPGTAYFYIDAMASDKISGSLPNIKALCKGIECWNPVTEAYGWTQDPSLICQEIICNSRWGAGAPRANLIAADWAALTAYCGASIAYKKGSTDTQVRARLDAVLDRDDGPLAWVTNLLRTCNAAPIMRGRKWSVTIDKARSSDMTFRYSGANANELMGDCTAKLESMHKTPTEIEVQYNDEDEDYEHDSVVVPYSVAQSYRLRQTVQAIGCTRRAQALRLAYRLLNGVWLQPRLVLFKGMPDAIEVEAGWVVTVQSEIEGATAGKDWRVLQRTIDPAKLEVAMVCREYSKQLYAMSEAVPM